MQHFLKFERREIENIDTANDGGANANLSSSIDAANINFKIGIGISDIRISLVLASS